MLSQEPQIHQTEVLRDYSSDKEIQKIQTIFPTIEFAHYSGGFQD